MNEDLLTKATAISALIGLVLIYIFSPHNVYQKQTTSQLDENCEGLVEVSGSVIKTFYSKNSNFIGVLSDGKKSILVLLNNYPVTKGESVLIRGRASPYAGSCWLFPDELEVLK